MLADLLRSKIADHVKMIEQLVAEKRAWELNLADLYAALNGHGKTNHDIIGHEHAELLPDLPERLLQTNGVRKYNMTWTYREKTKYILERENRPMTCAMVVNAAIAIEPALGGKNHENTMKSISRVLAIGVDKKKYRHVENIKGGRRLFEIVK